VFLFKSGSGREEKIHKGRKVEREGA